MKTSEILHHVGKSNIEETPQIAKTSQGLKYLLFLFLLSSISFLPSCAVELRTPQPGVSIENNHRHRHHRNYRHSRNQHVDVEIHNR